MNAPRQVENRFSAGPHRPDRAIALFGPHLIPTPSPPGLLFPLFSFLSFFFFFSFSLFFLSSTIPPPLLHSLTLTSALLHYFLFSFSIYSYLSFIHNGQRLQRFQARNFPLHLRVRG